MNEIKGEEEEGRGGKDEEGRTIRAPHMDMLMVIITVGFYF